MAYWDLNMLASDADFLARTVACAASEGLPDPDYWAVAHRWEVCAAPGFADAYASALAGNVPNPGRDPAVISDAQLLAQVQALRGT